MLFLWRGFGWTVPLIGLGSVWLVNDVMAVGAPHAFSVGLVLTGMVAVGLGYLLNWRLRGWEQDPKTGHERRSPSHHFWFIPIELWGLFALVIAGSLEWHRGRDDKPVGPPREPTVQARSLGVGLDAPPPKPAAAGPQAAIVVLRDGTCPPSFTESEGLCVHDTLRDSAELPDLLAAYRSGAAPPLVRAGR